jgi:hypothetical protein
MTPLLRGAIVVSALLAMSLGPSARGASVTVSFDEPQLVNNDPILTFYDGGSTYRGITGGPNYGVAFTINARVFTQTSGLTGTFTRPGIAELYSDTAREGEGIGFTMDVYPGFSSSLSFDYAAIDAAGELKVYSGLDGTGTLLTDVALPVTSPITGPGIFVADTVTFSGIAHSAVFDGGNKQLAIDDVALSLVPEPPSWHLLASSCLVWGLVCLARWMRLARRRRPLSA